jgi:hypothetical protein
VRTALAYLNWGRWVADCPEPGCNDARAVYHRVTGQRQTEDMCAKGHLFRIDMPPPALESQLVAVLSERALESDRSWYPKGHPRATLAGLPTGQSVAELVDEGKQVAQFRAAEERQEQGRLRELLTGLGLQVGPDGRVEGNI